MSDTVDEPLTEEPIASEAEEPVETEEPVVEAPVASEAVEPEEPVAEEPVASEAVEAEEPVASEAVEAEEPVASEAVEAEEPVASEAVEAEEPVVEEESEPEPIVEEEPVTPVLVEQVANDIREILTNPVVESEQVSSELSGVSLATLIRVLGQWSGGDIRKRSVESELLSGTETDENLDNVEKMVEILKLWIQEGGPGFKSHDNYFKNIDEYTLVGESKNWSDEKKKEVVLQVVTLTMDASNRRISSENIHSIVNSL